MESVFGKLKEVSAEANRTGPYELGDFTTTGRVVFISIPTARAEISDQETRNIKGNRNNEVVLGRQGPWLHLSSEWRRRVRTFLSYASR